jgi:hypothetical protein
MQGDLQAGRDAMWTGDALLHLMDRGWLVNQRPAWKHPVRARPEEFGSGGAGRREGVDALAQVRGGWG